MMETANLVYKLLVPIYEDQRAFRELEEAHRDMTNMYSDVARYVRPSRELRGGASDRSGRAGGGVFVCVFVRCLMGGDMMREADTTRNDR